MARKSNKRGNNEGSVYQMKTGPKKGQWAAAVSLGYNQEGKAIRKVMYASTRQEAATKLAELLDKSYKGLVADPSKVTVAEYAKVYLAQAIDGKAANTVRNYTHELNQAVMYLGTHRLQAVKPNHVQSMLVRMKEEGWLPKASKGKEKPVRIAYSARTIKKVLERLRAMFSQALRHQLVYINPCDSVQAPKFRTEPIGRALEPEEIKTLLVALQDHPMGPFFRLLLDTGLRKGEALGLTWNDVDLDSTPAWLEVNKAWSNNKLTTPKTRRSKRRIPIPPSSADVLRVLKASMVEILGTGIGSLYIFGNPVTGKPFDANSPNHAIRRLCVQTGIKPIRVHTLRHTYGSLALSQGVPLEVVAARMGHSSPTVTLNIYRHLLDKERELGIIDLTAMHGAQPLDPKKSKATLKPKAK